MIFLKDDENKNSIEYNNPLMFIDSIKDEIKDNNNNVFDSRKMDCLGINKINAHKINKFRDYVNEFKKGHISICKYNNQLIIPYKLDNSCLYGIKVLENVDNQLVRLKEEVVIPLSEDITLIR